MALVVGDHLEAGAGDGRGAAGGRKANGWPGEATAQPGLGGDPRPDHQGLRPSTFQKNSKDPRKKRRERQWKSMEMNEEMNGK